MSVALSEHWLKQKVLRESLRQNFLRYTEKFPRQLFTLGFFTFQIFSASSCVRLGRIKYRIRT